MVALGDEDGSGEIGLKVRLNEHAKSAGNAGFSSIESPRLGTFWSSPWEPAQGENSLLKYTCELCYY
jgi:hypothetical protein